MSIRTSNGFVPNGSTFADVIADTNTDTSWFKLWDQNNGEYYIKGATSTNGNWVSADSLAQMELPDETNNFYVKSYGPNSGESGWNDFTVSVGYQQSTIVLSNQTFEANTTVSYDQLIETSNFVSDAQIRIYNATESTYLGDGWIQANELSNYSFNTGSDGEANQIWVNTWLSASGQSGWEDFEVTAEGNQTPTPIGDEFQVNSYTDDNQEDPSVVSLSNGDFLVTWESEGQDGSEDGIFGQRFDADGNPIGSEFQINSYTDDNQEDPSVASQSNGGFVVTWESEGQDGSDEGIFGQRFDSDGNPIGNEFQINSYTQDWQDNPSVDILSDGDFVVTWQSGDQDGSEGGIFGQRFDADGNPIGSEFQINSYTDDNQEDPSVASQSNGGFVVTWESEGGQDGSDEGVFGQRFDADGNPVGSEFQINSYTDDGQELHSLASLPNGGFVVTWESQGQDGSDWGVFGQRFDADGNPVGNEFQVNSYTDDGQGQPSVTPLPNSGFVVSWTSQGQDGSELGVYGQLFDANSKKIGDEFQINSHTDDTQWESSVASLSDSEFIVTWASQGQDGSGYGIFGQRFEVDGDSVTQSSLMNASELELMGIKNSQDDLTVAVDGM